MAVKPQYKGLEHGHEPHQIAERLSRTPVSSYLRDWVYGGIDGAVTTFAIVAGATGAALSNNVILILGIANLLADGFSMAAANFIGTKAETDDYERLKAREQRHIQQVPEGEREEIRQILISKGFEGEILENAAAVITSSEQRWIDTMLTEEYGLPPSNRSAWKAALATFMAFLLCGIIPIIPFIFGVTAGATSAAAMTAVVFFGIGSAKSYWSLAHWSRSGLETVGLGMTAAGLAYGVGAFLRNIIG